MRASVTSALCLLALLQSACEDSPKPAPGAPSASVATTTTPTASAAAAVPTPEPLDVAALDAALKCGGKGHGPCAVLQDFHDCIAWSPVTASGDARWLGEGYVVSRGAFVDQLTLVRSKRVPTTEVGAGQLPVRIGIAAIPDDMAAERTHAEKAIKAFKRSDVARKGNQAIDYIKSRTDWPEAFAMQSKNNQVYVAVEGGVHLCALKDQRLLMVKASTNRAHPADGVYATLWAVSW
jgi:hypothetical protein